MTPDKALPGYYARRAAEYEQVYHKPERQADLAALRTSVGDLLLGRHVLELACGTGYWTECYVGRARSVVATDIGVEVLAVAQTKPSLMNRVTFRIADAYEAAVIPGDFDAAIAGFWWSHVPVTRLKTFLTGLHRRVGSGARIVLFDNRYVDGSSIPIARKDDQGNTYQNRQLADGSTVEVLKNFATPAMIRREVDVCGGRDVSIELLTYYWLATYVVV